LENLLTINNISKAYGPIKALKNVSFDVPEGSVFGILGPNGSGKTTLLGILLEVLNADEGNYSWLGGLPPNEARRRIGSLLETPNFYHYLSAMDNLKITASIRGRGMDDRERVLKLLKLYERRNSKFQTFSLGMKQRLAIAATLLGGPKVLVLDEPTNGLDPEGIAEIREMIQALNEEGITIIMASHLLDEVEKVCNHVAILKKGELLVSGPVDEILRSEDQVEVKAANMELLQSTVSVMPGIVKAQMRNGCILLSCESTVKPYHVNEYCMSKGITLSHLVMKKKSLETKFIEITK
jgi:ABC-type multidrug transport system ATPase subunit